MASASFEGSCGHTVPPGYWEEVKKWCWEGNWQCASSGHNHHGKVPLSKFKREHWKLNANTELGQTAAGLTQKSPFHVNNKRWKTISGVILSTTLCANPRNLWAKPHLPGHCYTVVWASVKTKELAAARCIASVISCHFSYTRHFILVWKGIRSICSWYCSTKEMLKGCTDFFEQLRDYDFNYYTSH